ncbi:MAG: TatD family hydrolase [Hahellaceae bacterium]|nr:TatD family hydrolase [Hahellaceae bacterium]
MYLDSHCHLDRLDLTPFDHSLDKALQSARQNGVSGFLCVDIDLDNFAAVRQIAEAHPDIWCSAGVHPNAEFDTPLTAETLKALALSSPKVVAIGECGLDYYRGLDDRLLQLERFQTQLDVAVELDLPVIIHTREAREDTLLHLRRFAAQGGRGVLHCFTESLEMAQEAIEFGFMVSFSGIITFRNAQPLRDVVKALPLESLLIETDSPYLAPVPHRGKSNHPGWVVDVAACMADVKQVPPERVAQQTQDNFFRLFSRAQRAPA